MNETQELMPHSGGNAITDSVASGNYSRAMGGDELRATNIDRGGVEPMADIPRDVAMPTGSLRDVSINPLSSGYLVKVGCQTVAVETTEKLVDMLNKYLTNPHEFERKWYSKDVRNRLENI